MGESGGIVPRILSLGVRLRLVVDTSKLFEYAK